MNISVSGLTSSVALVRPAFLDYGLILNSNDPSAIQKQQIAIIARSLGVRFTATDITL
ncbi:hypothetical protein [Nostoc sp.]|uniref:hypothetical protein n=1 Tax=Nostoc sp. TaxID=1180 RepID=UPI002FFB4B56